MPSQTLAYASTTVNPGINNNTPKIIDLSVDNLPVASVHLYGQGVDANAGIHNYTYHWTVVDAPNGTAGALSDASAQNPTYGPIDLPGTYLFRLCATSDGAGNASDDVQVTVPSKALIRIATADALTALQMPANYQRNWGDKVREYAFAIRTLWAMLLGWRLDDLYGIKNVVADATLKYRQLVEGGVATFGGNALHTHSGADVGVADQTHLGVVLIEGPALDAANPVAINVERLLFTSFVDGTPTDHGYRAAEISTPKPNIGTVRATAMWYIADPNTTLKDLAIALSDGGSIAGNVYQFKVYQGSIADWLIGTPADTGLVINMSHAVADGSPIAKHVALDFPVTQGDFVGVICTQYPTTPGNGLNITLIAHRSV